MDEIEKKAPALVNEVRRILGSVELKAAEFSPARYPKDKAICHAIEAGEPFKEAP